MDWSHSLQTNRQHYTTTLNLESRGGGRKEDGGRPRNTWRRDLEADVKETGYTWRDRTGVMLATYALEGATKALID